LNLTRIYILLASTVVTDEPTESSTKTTETSTHETDGISIYVNMKQALPGKLAKLITN